MTVRGADGSLAGVVPLRVTRASLSFDVCHRVLGAVNVSAVEVLGSQPLIPSTSTHHDRLFSTIIGAFPGCHAITMRNVPTDSFLWRHCHESKVLRSQFIVYVPYGKRHCHTIPLPATFEEYLTQFSAKKRYNLRRQVRRLHTHARGAVELRRIEAPNDVTRADRCRRNPSSRVSIRLDSMPTRASCRDRSRCVRRPGPPRHAARLRIALRGRPCAAAVGGSTGVPIKMGSPMAAHILKGHDRMIHDESMAAFSPRHRPVIPVHRGPDQPGIPAHRPGLRGAGLPAIARRILWSSAATILLLRRTFSNSVYHVGHAAFRAGVGARGLPRRDQHRQVPAAGAEPS
mgnify:CR=1 FL=1